MGKYLFPSLEKLCIEINENQVKDGNENNNTNKSKNISEQQSQSSGVTNNMTQV